MQTTRLPTSLKRTTRHLPETTSSRRRLRTSLRTLEFRHLPLNNRTIRMPRLAAKRVETSRCRLLLPRHRCRRRRSSQRINLHPDTLRLRKRAQRCHRRRPRRLQLPRPFRRHRRVRATHTRHLLRGRNRRNAASWVWTKVATQKLRASACRPFRRNRLRNNLICPSRTNRLVL